MHGNELSSLYKNRFSYPDATSRRNAVWKEIVACGLQRFIKENDTVVDVACGYGEFINNVRAGRKIAVDLNADSAEYLDGGIEFYCLDALSMSQSQSLLGVADVVFTSNFLEHLPDKSAVLPFLNEVSAVLKPGGRYITMGPNIRYCAGEYWDYLDHNVPLSSASVTEALQICGFAIVHTTERFIPYSFKGFMTSSALSSPLLSSPLLSSPLSFHYITPRQGVLEGAAVLEVLGEAVFDRGGEMQWMIP
ncbi:MAG: class I SAM-dependent methyltransferase [Synergistaceae bacterium]|jgi:SAM-dependent methyltransferase|nr:class I SAM-dependent methyltransferase [Synergistaceae bacterium]